MIAHAIALWYPRLKWPHLCTLVHDTVPAFFATPKLLILFREFDRCARPEECVQKSRIKETSCFRWPDYFTPRAFTPADKNRVLKAVTYNLAPGYHSIVCWVQTIDPLLSERGDLGAVSNPGLLVVRNKNKTGSEALRSILG